MKTSNLTKVAAVIAIAIIASVNSTMASNKTSEKNYFTKEFIVNDLARIDTSEVALMTSGMRVGEFLERNIKYPAAALENGIEGHVDVLCKVGTNGLISDVKIMNSVDDRLSQEVIKAVKKLSFIPATQNGYAASYTILIPVTFDLR